jgi:tetratricopeptide (TPR) repeat protein
MIQRHLLATLLAVLMPALASHADFLADARDRVANGEHESAVPLFEKHLQASPPSAEVYFELGKAQEAAGREAEAALAFRRTLILDPSFAPAREALRNANIQLGLPAAPGGWRSAVASRVSPDLFANAGAILFWIGAFALATGLFFSGRRALKISAIALAVLGLGLVALAWLVDPRVGESRDAVILAREGAALYRTPSEDESQKLTTLGQGTVLKILSVRGRWFHGELPGGQRGWFLQKGTEMVIPPA